MARSCFSRARRVRALGDEDEIIIRQIASAFAEGIPLPTVVDGISRRAYHTAAGLFRRGNIEAARALFERIPRGSPMAGHHAVPVRNVRYLKNASTATITPMPMREKRAAEAASLRMARAHT